MKIKEGKMPYAVTHILVPLILIGLFRDYVSKRRFPLYYVFIGGIAGILPDLDVIVFYILSFFGFALNEVHRTFSHTLFFPLLFLLLGLLTIKNRGRRKLNLSIIFLVISFGIFTHLVLDGILSGKIIPFYPISYYSIGLNLISLAPFSWQPLILPSLDAALLILWLCYLEVKHKISDFV